MISQDNCCGCTACENICPANAISIRPDEKGFMAPFVTEDCVKCGKCITVCAYKNRIKNGLPDRVYAQRVYGIKKKEGRRDSQSGGAFAALAEYAINRGYVVYGVRMAGIRAVYSRVTDLPELSSLKGSKYIRAEMDGAFGLCAEDLTDGRKVLFSGTPCHIDGLKSYMISKGISTDNLVTVDLVCHGTPSPRVFGAYIGWLSERLGEIKSFNFRLKRWGGWHLHLESFTTGRKRYHSSNFVNIFYSHKCLGESCYTCPYATTSRIADITIGDFWGIEKIDPKYDDGNGISLVITNSSKGQSFFHEIAGKIELREYRMEDSIQPNLLHPTEKPADTEAFWDDYAKNGFEHSVRKYCDFSEKNILDRSLHARLIRRSGIILRSIIDGVRRRLG